MILEKVEPFGYCKGVNVAIKNLHNIIKNNPKKQIHLIGLIVHNQKTNNELLKSKNVFLHNGKNRKKIIGNILKRSKNKTNLLLVLSTHGTDPQAIELIKKYNCQYYDFTCGYIRYLVQKIQNALAKRYKIYFYGKKNHPETQFMKKTFGKALNVFWQKNDLKPNKCKKIVVCQTTTNYQDFQQIKKWFKNAIFEETICSFCKQKQIKANKFINSKDSIVVISDPKSNNGLILFKMLKNNNKYVYFLNPNQSKAINVKKTNKLFVFTSSSVSKKQANFCLKNKLINY